MRSRRLFLLLLLLTMVALVAGVSACGDDGETSTTASTSPGGTTATSGAQGPQTGGTLKVATEPATNRDPAFASARADILINQQVYDWLVEIGHEQPAASRPGHRLGVPRRQGLDLHPPLRRHVLQRRSRFTADDVVYTFDRLRDPDVGSPAASASMPTSPGITAVDATHVEFTLNDPNPEFPSDVADYHAAILSKAVADPAADLGGHRPLHHRVVLGRRPGHPQEEPGLLDEGRPGTTACPTSTSSSSSSPPTWPGRWRPSRETRCSSWPGSPRSWSTPSRPTASSQVITGPSSAFHYVIHMRSDAGRPAADARVRQALQLGTDHQGLIDQVRPGLAVVGNGTPVGPAYGDYYLDQAPAYDPEQAKELLAEAGYADGLTITLYAQQALEVPAIATVWKEQMKAIGVTVDIQTAAARRLLR